MMPRFARTLKPLPPLSNAGEFLQVTSTTKFCSLHEASTRASSQPLAAARGQRIGAGKTNRRNEVLQS
jgi:hypothetical protein